MGIEHEPLICYNGAYVLNGTREIASTEIKTEHVADIHRMVREKDVKLGLYYKTEWYVEENTERVRKEIRYTRATPHFKDTRSTLSDWKNRKIGAHKIMLMGTERSADAIFPILTEHFGKDVRLYRSNDTLIEIAPRTVSKLTAIKLLLKEDESLADVIAFGDNFNDIEMLKHCGYGVAVGNARKEVKAIADTVALPNHEDGVARFIEKNRLRDCFK